MFNFSFSQPQNKLPLAKIEHRTTSLSFKQLICCLNSIIPQSMWETIPFERFLKFKDNDEKKYQLCLLSIFFILRPFWAELQTEHDLHTIEQAKKLKTASDHQKPRRGGNEYFIKLLKYGQLYWEYYLLIKAQKKEPNAISQEFDSFKISITKQYKKSIQEWIKETPINTVLNNIITYTKEVESSHTQKFNSPKLDNDEPPKRYISVKFQRPVEKAIFTQLFFVCPTFKELFEQNLVRYFYLVYLSSTGADNRIHEGIQKEISTITKCFFEPIDEKRTINAHQEEIVMGEISEDKHRTCDEVEELLMPSYY